MAPHPDDHFLPFREIASPEEADLEYRKLTVGHALSELGIARGVQLDDAHLLVYTRALIDLDTELVVEACRYFGLQKRKDGETALPSVGDLRDRCRRIRAEQQRVEDERAYEEAYRRKHDVMPAARRAELDAWLAHCFDQITGGKPYPSMPGGTHDSLDVTYRCAECHDAGFVRVCECGRGICADCRYQRMAKCGCRPQPAPQVPPEPKPARRQRGTGWHRAGG